MNDNLSSILEKFNIDKNSISPDMVNSLMNMLNNTNKNSESEQDNIYKDTENNYSNIQNNIDLESILKMKSIIDKINVRNDPRSKLLESLKPYLKESRRNKIDQYIQLMNAQKIMESFNLFNGDNNDSR